MRRHSMVVATTARYYDVMTHILTLHCLRRMLCSNQCVCGMPSPVTHVNITAHHATGIRSTALVEQTGVVCCHLRHHCLTVHLLMQLTARPTHATAAPHSE